MNDETVLLLPEHEELRNSVREFLEQVSPMPAVREVMASAQSFDEPGWRRAVEELQLTALTIPEAFGGLGYGAVELAVVMEAAGRVLYPSPLLGSVALATTALVRGGNDELQQRYLPRLAAGELIATMSLATTDLPLAHESSDGWQLDGVIDYLIDGSSAGLIVTPAETADGLAVFVVDTASGSLTATPHSTMDQTRKLAHVELASTRADVLVQGGEATTLIDAVRGVGIVVLAFEQVGGAAAVLEMTVGYAKERVQFGRPIGSFQAVKHRCADMLVDVEEARSLAIAAAWAVANGSDDRHELVHMAKALCSDAYVACAGAAIQLHGGIGFTWEHPAHLYFKRAKSSQLMFGDPVHHRRILADLVLGGS